MRCSRGMSDGSASLGIGAAPDLRAARKRTQVGSVALAPGHALETEHAFVDATGGLDEHDVDAALATLAAAGCDAVAVSGALAVDDPEAELLAARCAHAHGLPACVGHDLTGAYGLEMRTVSAAVNASILPVVERTASVVEEALKESGLDVPLLVLRGDGGAMSAEAFRRRPSFTIGSGPAAGVAAALHQLGLSDAIVVECGGTSSNVSIVKRGRPVVRSLRVMGRPTCVRAVDSWVVGAAGGSMALLKRRSVAETGPAQRPHRRPAVRLLRRAGRARRRGARARRSPRRRSGGVRLRARRRDARTRSRPPAPRTPSAWLARGAYSFAGREAALAAFAPLGARLKTTPERAAAQLLDGAVEKIVKAVADAARQHELGPDVPLVALGGAGEALVPARGRAAEAAVVHPEHPEILSSIGAAVSLVRAELTRNATTDGAAVELAREAEAACVASGAAPATVSVETALRRPRNVLRAVATGAVALEVGAADREPAGDGDAAARGSRCARARPRCAPADRRDGLLPDLLARTGPAASRPSTGSARSPSRRMRAACSRRSGPELVEQLLREVQAATRNLGVATLLPRVSLVYGSRILDLSDARRPEDVAAAAARSLEGEGGTAVAVVAR